MTERALRGPVLLLGSTQTLAWASSHYLPTILAVPMARNLGTAPATVFAACSLALLTGAAMGSITNAMAAHLTPLLQLAGATLALAVLRAPASTAATS